MIYTLVIHSTSAHFNPISNDRGILESQDARRYDLECWACDMRKEPTYGDWYTNQCHLEGTRRIFVILEFVIAAVVCAVAVWALPAERKRHSDVVEMKRIRHKPFRTDNGW